MREHACQAIIIRCIDFRLSSKKIAELLNQYDICKEGEFDLVSVAGAGKDLVSKDPHEADFLLKQIKISIDLHQSKKIIILMHDNCGAYGIADSGQEQETQNNDLKNIYQILKNKFNQADIKLYRIEGTKTGDLKLIEFQPD